MSRVKVNRQAGGIQLSQDAMFREKRRTQGVIREGMPWRHAGRLKVKQRENNHNGGGKFDITGAS